MGADPAVKYLLNFTDNTNYNESNKCVQEIASCNFGALLHSKFVADFYGVNLKAVPEMGEEDNELFCTAIAFALAFVQSNFVGPQLSDEYRKFLDTHWPQNLNARSELTVDSEELNVNVKFPEFLLAGKILLDAVETKEPDSVEIKWWKLRLICLHQQILDELSQSLYSNFKESTKLLQENFSQLKSKEFQALIMLEISEGFLLFHRSQKSSEWLDRVCGFLDIDLNVEGLLGLRTKFQQKALPQLCLKVISRADNTLPLPENTNGKLDLPGLLKLDDEVRLERIKFINVEDNEVMTNSSVVQCIILAKLKLVLKSQPKDKLSAEEVEPFLTTLLYQESGPLSVRLATLLQNIVQESSHKRTVERSLKQCEEILSLINGDKFAVFERLSYFFASLLYSNWNIRKQLGDLMISLGLIKSGLDLYLNIQSWEDVIECYNRLELRHKAAEIIREQLDKEPSVLLYCLLGDATDNVSYYEQAWTFSKKTSSRAQRHWGNYYFAKKDYETAVPYLQKSLEINSLQEVTLLRLGYSAINLEKWDLAVQTYLRYTHLEPRGFESWNNLAKALIKLGDKKRAHKILNEALKCNFNNWKVWENFLIVSVDTGNFEDVINAYTRLVEIKEKHLDVEVLEITVNAVKNNILDSQGRPSVRLKKKLNDLLAHQCVQYANEPKIWELSSELADTELARSQKLQRSYRAYTQSTQSWVSTKGLCSKIMEICRELCISSLNAIEVPCNDMEKSSAVSQISSARLSAQACVRAVENAGESIVVDWDQCEGILNEMKSLLERLTNELKKK